VFTGKLADVTGPNITEPWGVTSTDLGASVVAPNGKLVSVFGDTFSGRRVGEGDWRSPVALIGTGDANNEIVYEYAGGEDPATRANCGPTFMTMPAPDGPAAASAR
jgi:Domain of unknown function (DUF4185)